MTAELLRQTLDALGLDRVRAVGGSIGNLWVLRLAQAHPARVERLVLLGAGPLTSDIGVPPFIRLLRTPLGKLITVVPENRRMLGRQLGALGHATGGDAGQIPKAFIDWRLGRHGYLPGLVLTNAEIAGIEQPTLMVYGTADPIGSIASWRRFTGRLPQGELEVVEGGGHLVWYSDPGRVGARVAQYLTG